MFFFLCLNLSKGGGLVNYGYNLPSYNMPMNAYSTPNFNFNTQGQQLVRVTGLEGAKAFNMQPNSTVALFDNNEDFMYIKVTDGAGFPSIRKFSFTEVLENDNVVNSENWVSREEFEQFKREVTDIGKQFIQFTKQPEHNKQQTRNAGNGQKND